MQQGVKEKARALLENGTVSRVLGWKKGEFCYDLTPAVFASAEEVDRDFVYSDFSGANLSKYLIAESNKEGKIAAFAVAGDRPARSIHIAQPFEAVSVGILAQIGQNILRAFRTFRNFSAHIVHQLKTAFQRHLKHGRVFIRRFHHGRVRHAVQLLADAAITESDARKNKGYKNEQSDP